MTFKNRLSRFLNSINPNAPKGIIHSAEDWVQCWSKKNANLRSVQPSSWHEHFEPPQNRFVDFSRVNPVTEEDQLLKASYSINGFVRSRGRHLYSIQNGRILGRDGAVISPDNRLFWEFTYSNDGYENHPVFRRRKIPKIERLRGNYVTLTYPDSSNYYHWLIESLPNLRSVEKWISMFDGFFVPELSRFHVESLKCFGIKEEKLIPLLSNSHYRCDQLYVPAFNYGYTLYDWVPEWLQKRSIIEKNSEKNNKLYISRRDTNARRVTNENEVMEILRPHGYELVESSKLTFEQQAQLFNSAASIIAGHGAGLANMVFCQKGARVLEIFPPLWTPLCYVHLAIAAELDYNFMIAQPLSVTEPERKSIDEFVEPDVEASTRAMEIPLDKLERYVQACS